MRNLVLSALTIGLLALPAQAASPAHPAATPPEKWLETLINDDFGPIRITSKLQDKLTSTDLTPKASPLRGLSFADILTKPLFDAIKATEVATVKASCKGAYRAGESCGMEYNPFICGQDVMGTPLLFRTVKATDDSALIDYWNDLDQVVVGRYLLRKTKDRWQLDGIHCVDLADFNFKEETP